MVRAPERRSYVRKVLQEKNRTKGRYVRYKLFELWSVTLFGRANTILYSPERRGNSVWNLPLAGEGVMRLLAESVMTVDAQSLTGGIGATLVMMDLSDARGVTRNYIAQRPVQRLGCRSMEDRRKSGKQALGRAVPGWYEVRNNYPFLLPASTIRNHRPSYPPHSQCCRSLADALDSPT
ncbi:hypothetical protein PENSPDRAFT_651815 [Peniophora sp. CONT]|nr:hypothetical protein PENSPDRAFT_651815 [Peniophora sp. CONT]